MKPFNAEGHEDAAPINIFQLHDFVIGLGNADDGCRVDNIVLESHELLQESDRKALEDHVNQVLQACRDLDAHLHDVAEFSC